MQVDVVGCPPMEGEVTTASELPINTVTRPGAAYYHVEQIRSAYAALQDDYNAFALKETSKSFWDAFLRELNEGDLVLDLGCGSGVADNYFMSNGMQVIGVDTSHEMLTLAKKQAPEATFFRANMEHMQWKSCSFDGACAFFSLLHMPKEKVRCLLSSTKNWLKENGILALAVVEGTGEGLCESFMGKGLPVYLSYYTEKEMRMMLEEAGFTILSTKAVSVSAEGFEETELFLLATKHTPPGIHRY